MMNRFNRIFKMMIPVLALVMVFVLMPQSARAEITTTGDTAGVSSLSEIGLEDRDRHIFDYAGLLDASDVDTLERLCTKTGKDRGTDFIVILMSRYDGMLSDVKANTQRARYGAVDKYNCNILFVCMGSRDIRVFSVEGANEAHWMGDSLCQYIYEEIAPYFTKKNYRDGIKEYVELVDHYWTYKPNYNPNSIFYKWPFQFCIAAIISAIISYSLIAKSKGKVTVNEKTYLEPDRDVAKDDMFLRRTITKTRIQSSSGGGGGGHSGGGGGGHSGGGGGKF